VGAHGAAISGEHLQVRFDDGTTAFEDLDIHLGSGEVIAIVGASGCGKTTLLRTLAGLQALTSGELHFDPPRLLRAGQLGYVFQNSALMPWRSAWQNVALPLELVARSQSLTGRQRKQRACEWLSTVGLAPEDYAKRPAQLSGGMQMRVSIARALITEPSILLLDEPFSALDDVLRTRLGQLLQQLWIEKKCTVVLVTHNIQEAVWISQRVLVMDSGRMIAEIPNDLPYPRDTAALSDPRLQSRVAEVTELLIGASA